MIGTSFKVQALDKEKGSAYTVGHKERGKTHPHTSASQGRNIGNLLSLINRHLGAPGGGLFFEGSFKVQVLDSRLDLVYTVCIG